MQRPTAGNRLLIQRGNFKMKRCTWNCVALLGFALLGREPAMAAEDPCCQHHGVMCDSNGRVIKELSGDQWRYCAPYPPPTNKTGTANKSSPAACPNSAMSYLTVRAGRKEDGLGGGGYVIENSCKSSAIQVTYNTLDVLCKQESNSQRVSGGGNIPDYSYCKTPPQITGANFVK
jgi:hypothetical protein